MKFPEIMAAFRKNKAEKEAQEKANAEYKEFWDSLDEDDRKAFMKFAAEHGEKDGTAESSGEGSPKPEKQAESESKGQESGEKAGTEGQGKEPVKESARPPAGSSASGSTNDLAKMSLDDINAMWDKGDIHKMYAQVK